MDGGGGYKKLEKEDWVWISKNEIEMMIRSFFRCIFSFLPLVGASEVISKYFFVFCAIQPVLNCRPLVMTFFALLQLFLRLISKPNGEKDATFDVHFIRSFNVAELYS